MTDSIRLLAAIEAIYAASLDYHQWPEVLGCVADVFGDVGAVMLWRRDNETFGSVASPSLAAAQQDYIDGWGKQDIKAELCERSGLFFSGEPFTDRHIESTGVDFLNHPFTTQFLTKHGLGWFGGIAVSPDPHVGVMLSIQRNFRIKPRYSDYELETIGIIGRHIERSLRLSIRLLDAELANVGLGEALTRIGIGVFALDARGRVVFSNPAAQGHVGDTLTIIDNQLRIRASAVHEAFRDAVAHVLHGNIGNLETRPILLHSDETGRRVVIHLLPISAPVHLAENFLTKTRAIVLVIEQKIDEPADPAVVRDVLGLTLGEARVAAMVGAGLAPREAAHRLGIAEETARNVLKRVFGKTGVSRQSELTALLARLVLR